MKESEKAERYAEVPFCKVNAGEAGRVQVYSALSLVLEVVDAAMIKAAPRGAKEKEIVEMYDIYVSDKHTPTQWVARAAARGNKSQRQSFDQWK